MCPLWTYTGAIHWAFVGALSSSWKAYHGGPVKVLAAHPDERLLLSTGKDAAIRVWAPEGGSSCTAVYKGHREQVTHMSFVAGREWVCSSDGEASLLFVLRGQTPFEGIEARMQHI